MRLLLREGLRMRVPYVQLHLRAVHLMSCAEHGGPRLVLPALPLPHEYLDLDLEYNLSLLRLKVFRSLLGQLQHWLQVLSLCHR